MVEVLYIREKFWELISWLRKMLRRIRSLFA